MSNWTDGYITEIEYTHGFYRELTPSLLNFALLLKGVRPPAINSGFTYCELGFGQGFSTNLLAAANPHGEFWATDFNPSHAAGAKQLATAAGTRNVHFFDKSFSEFLDLDTPEFDYINLHGIYSWITPENRQTIVEIIRRKLKFGGVVYISYNCLPGWSAAMPLRQLIAEHGATSKESKVRQIDQGIEFAQKLIDLKAGYFVQNPGVAPRLERLKSMSRNYLVHEYLNREWTPQYFVEVAQELAEAKLTFSASAHLADHLDFLNLSEEARNILSGINDLHFQETVRDYFLNQQFRKDIFVKGSVKLSLQEQAELLLATRFALTSARADVKLKATFAVGEVGLQAEVYNPVLDVLEKGPATLDALLSQAALREIGYARVLQALTVLTSMGHVSPGLPEEGDAERLASTSAFNNAVAERARFSDQLAYLASPVVGGGVPVNRFEQLFLLATRKGADLPGTAWQVLASQNQRLIKDGQMIQSPEGNIAELQARADTFRTQAIPVLNQLGIS